MSIACCRQAAESKQFSRLFRPFDVPKPPRLLCRTNQFMLLLSPDGFCWILCATNLLKIQKESSPLGLGTVAQIRGVGTRPLGQGQRKNTIINIGVAAHITAASPGTPEKPAPRYDKTLTREQRRDISNGILLCQNCAKLVDSDVSQFTVSVLQKWRKEAEDRAFLVLARAWRLHQSACVGI